MQKSETYQDDNPDDPSFDYDPFIATFRCEDEPEHGTEFTLVAVHIPTKATRGVADEIRHLVHIKDYLVSVLFLNPVTLW